MSLHRYIAHSAASTFAQAMLAGGGDGGQYISADDSEPLLLGIGKPGPSNYYAAEAFLSFDTTAVGAPPAVSTLRLGIVSTATDDPGDLVVATYDWGVSIASADWRTSAQLAALTERGRVAFADYAALNTGDYIDFDVDPAGIVLGGITRLVVFSDSEATPTTDPTTSNQQFFVDGDGGASPPVLLMGAPPPHVGSITPPSGVSTGGNEVVIAGNHFAGTTDVEFGVGAGASFVVDSDSQIRAVAPAHVAGTVQVIVTTPDGSSA